MSRKIKLIINNETSFKQGCEEYLLDCKARNLREGTIKHYKDSSKQIMKYIGEDTLIKDINKAQAEQKKIYILVENQEKAKKICKLLDENKIITQNLAGSR